MGRVSPSCDIARLDFRDLLWQGFEIEAGMTRRVLDRVPTDKPDWVPHPRSMPLGRLAMHVATLPRLATLCLTTPGFDLAAASSPDLTLRSHARLLETFDESLCSLQTALSTSTDEHLSEPWRFSFGDRVLSKTPRGVTLLHMFLGHLSHHRAQLGTYLRLLDLPVPGVYGPSADESLRR